MSTQFKFFTIGLVCLIFLISFGITCVENCKLNKEQTQTIERLEYLTESLVQENNTLKKDIEQLKRIPNNDKKIHALKQVIDKLEKDIITALIQRDEALNRNFQYIAEALERHENILRMMNADNVLAQ